MTDKDKFLRTLQETFDQLSAIHQSDFFDQVEFAELVESLSVEACRHGAGHLLDPEKPAMSAREALVVVGRLLDYLTPKSNLLTAKQAGAVLGVSTRTVYDLCESGRLRYQRVGVGRGTIRIRAADLDRIPQTSTPGLA
jgi:excisionase family DNA binding protein